MVINSCYEQTQIITTQKVKMWKISYTHSVCVRMCTLNHMSVRLSVYVDENLTNSVTKFNDIPIVLIASKICRNNVITQENYAKIYAYFMYIVWFYSWW